MFWFNLFLILDIIAFISSKSVFIYELKDIGVFEIIVLIAF